MLETLLADKTVVLGGCLVFLVILFGLIMTKVIFYLTGALKASQHDRDTLIATLVAYQASKDVHPMTGPAILQQIEKLERPKQPGLTIPSPPPQPNTTVEKTGVSFRQGAPTVVGERGDNK